MIDINLAVKRPGLGEEEEVESIKSLVKKKKNFLLRPCSAGRFV